MRAAEWIERCGCQRYHDRNAPMRWCIRSRHHSGLIWVEDQAAHYRTREAAREALRDRRAMDLAMEAL